MLTMPLLLEWQLQLSDSVHFFPLSISSAFVSHRTESKKCQSVEQDLHDEFLDGCVASKRLVDLCRVLVRCLIRPASVRSCKTFPAFHRVREA